MIHKNNGFTLVELLVVLALSGLVALGVFRTFTWQQKTYYTQERVASVQQDIRGGLDLMIRDIRMAGYSSKRISTAIGGITSATATSLVFTNDYNSNGSISAGEIITYDLNSGRLRRTLNGVAQIVLEDVDALNFVYRDSDGNVLASPVGTPSSIKIVEVTVVARVNRQDNEYKNNTVYKNRVGATVYTANGDGYRRRATTATINCRNLVGA